jgi:hypothetical protein
VHEDEDDPEFESLLDELLLFELESLLLFELESLLLFELESLLLFELESLLLYDESLESVVKYLLLFPPGYEELSELVFESLDDELSELLELSEDEELSLEDELSELLELFEDEELSGMVNPGKLTPVMVTFFVAGSNVAAVTLP